MRRLAKLASIPCIGILTLSACGSGDNANSKGATSSSANSSATASSSAATSSSASAGSQSASGSASSAAASSSLNDSYDAAEFRTLVAGAVDALDSYTCNVTADVKTASINMTMSGTQLETGLQGDLSGKTQHIQQTISANVNGTQRSLDSDTVLIGTEEYDKDRNSPKYEVDSADNDDYSDFHDLVFYDDDGQSPILGSAGTWTKQSADGDTVTYVTDAQNNAKELADSLGYDNDLAQATITQATVTVNQKFQPTQVVVTTSLTGTDDGQDLTGTLDSHATCKGFDTTAPATAPDASQIG